MAESRERAVIGAGVVGLAIVQPRATQGREGVPYVKGLVNLYGIDWPGLTSAHAISDAGATIIEEKAD